MVEHLGNRPVLSMDQLVEMKDLRPRLEKEIKLPADPNAKNRIYFFSVDGTLRGTRFTGCLMAGECIMVQSHTGFQHALNQAKDGLAQTMELAREYFEEMNRSVVVASPLDVSHMNVNVGGRRGHNVPGQPDLATDPKLKAMIRHVIGGKEWKG